jgi:aerobic-type carbon monoxide dehydrogenase small subunit (CoxS/CutS family)
MTTTELHVNGTARRVEADPERTLLRVLRDDLDLTGTKYGCGEGQCGACTVLLDGKAVRACKLTLGECDGRRITTIEGLEQNGKLHPVQEAFLAAGAMQCGYCIPGMIMAGVALLGKNPSPSAHDIGHSLEGHLCRCCTYPRIVQEMTQAAAAVKGGAR